MTNTKNTGGHILIVEDDAAIVAHLQDILTGSGYASLAVASGEAAIQRAVEARPDLVLMDIRLAGEMDGVEAAGQIRARLDVPVVYLTAYAEDDLLQRAKVTEPYSYLVKPVRERELLATVEMALYKHEMERKLKESERWLATTLKSIGDAVVATDEKGWVTFMNPVAEALTGWPQAEAVDRDLTAVFHIVNEVTRELAENPVTRALREGVVVGLANHTLLIAKDGTEIPVDDSAAPIRDDKGNLTGVVLVFRDITERKRGEDALAAERNLLRTLIDNLPDYIYVKDMESRFVANNIAHVRALGATTPEEVIGKTDLDLFPRELAEQYYADERAIIQSGQPLINREELVVHQDTGNRIWVSATKVPLRDQQGNITGLVGISRDITERVQAEDLIRTQRDLGLALSAAVGLEETLRLCVEGAIRAAGLDCGGVYLVDQTSGDVDLTFAKGLPPEFVKSASHYDADSGNARLVMAGNPIYTRHQELGVPLDESERREGLRALAVIPVHHKERVVACLNVASRTLDEIPVSARNVLETMAAQIGSAIARAQAEEALRQSNKRLEETLAELKATQEQMLQQERLAAVGQLAAGIAHDFNNILTGILGFAALLQGHPDMPESARPDLTRIVEQGQRAAHLVHQILDFSRKSIRQPQQLSLVPFLKEAAKSLERTMPESIHIRPEIEPGEYLIQVDSTQLQQLLTNLAVNARDAMPAGGELGLRLSHFTLQPGEQPPCLEMPPGEWVVFSISDTGAGIPAETLPHVFDPFFTTKEVGQGSGLGLAQVYGIVKQHEGCIDVDSQVGQGTTFTIYLPAPVEREKVPEPVALAEMLRGHGEVVLLVEDEPTVLTTGKSMLEHLGYRVLTAVNGQDALAVYAEHKDKIALVLTDMIMPEMDGVDLFRALQTQAPDIKVVMMTGYPLQEETLQGLVQGVVDWLPKPLTLPQVAQVIDQALR